ncbi:hypothetical protein ATL40_2336 [Serinibacter salmoneus]|uniref:Uncharacterized protein n=1 Tax=Serinibacter salmoneus TaxID=556530 RepID=A0A2A9D305_9MICO|nr:hypothetical protein ATL40_2336 [Serinibacter salmoneus]
MTQRYDNLDPEISDRDARVPQLALPLRANQPLVAVYCGLDSTASVHEQHIDPVKFVWLLSDLL